MDTFDNNDITENSDNTDITENTDNMEYIESTEEPEDPVSDPGDADSGDGKSADLKNGMIREILSWVEIIVAAFLLSMFVTKVILINATVPSGSMEHLIQPGDRLFGYRLSYVFSEPERFDVVIFKYPVDESENYIKRIIGLPGEHVEIDNGKIYINGSDKPLKEDYLPEKWKYDNDGYEYDVPEGCYLCLGDNRNISLDARFWAEEAYDAGLAPSVAEAWDYTFVKESQILGKAVIKYWPKVVLLSNYKE